jgi:hypothetical protein
MKTTMIIGMAMMVGASAVAQEYDDMYFRSKDREKVSTTIASTSDSYSSFKKKHFEEVTMLDDYANPTDSYSARNINPEYIARSNSEQASEDEQNYFVEGYNPQAKSNVGSYYGNNWGNNNWNNWNSWNRWNNWNPYFGSGMFMPSYYNSLYSPYYGWNDPWANPYWGGMGFNSGWSLSAGYFWGNSWGSGWNYGMGYNNWGMMNPYYGGMWGPSWGWNNWNRPYTTVVVVGEGARTNYGKRSTPNSSTAVNNVTNRSSRANSTMITDRNTTTGRVRTTADEYYVRPSRRTYTETNSSGNTGNTGSRYSGWNSNNNSNSYRNSNSSGFSSPSMSSPSRSSSGGSTMSAPSRSSSGSSGSSGSRRGGN